MEYVLIGLLGIAAAGSHQSLRPDRLMVRYGIRLRAAIILARRLCQSALAQARREWPDALLVAQLEAMRDSWN